MVRGMNSRHWVMVAVLLLGAGSGPAWSAEISDPLRDPLQLLDILEKRRKELDERARQQDFRDEELKRLEEKIEKRIQGLESLRLQIQTDMSREQKVDDENIRRLAKIYGNMKPKIAAEQLKAMDQKVVLRLLKIMPEKKTAQILNRMDPDTATPLAEALGLPLSDKRKAP